MANLTLQSTIELNDGNKVPAFGLGVYDMTIKETYSAVSYALEVGYRLIDSAEWYENEAECGRAIRDFTTRTNIPRSDIIFTTKLKANKGYEASKKAIERSLRACGLDYIDIYLLHSPLGGARMRKASWRAVKEAQQAGILKTVGVSNFGIRHLEELLSDPEELVPALNQVDLHPFMTREALVHYCHEKGIVLQAWAPLVRGLKFQHPVIKALAKMYHKDSAQILIRYSLQKGFICIPKSARKSRILSNTLSFDFELTGEEIKKLDDLDEYLVTDWDPTDAP